MKYSKTTLRELNAKYRAVLKKCLLINAAVLTVVALASPVNAAQITEGQTFSNGNNQDKGNQKAAGLTIDYNDALDNNGVNNVTFSNNTSVNSGAAMKALNGFTAGDNWTFDTNKSEKSSGGLYVKIPNKGSENRDVTFGNGTTFSNNSSKWLGGALGVETAGTVTLGDNTTFTTNHSDADGGAIAVWTDETNIEVTTGTTLNLGQTSFTGNTAVNRGGALANLNNDSSLTPYNNTVNIASGSTFTDNSANLGGAIYNSGTMNIQGATFEGNTSAEGGAIYNSVSGVLNFSGNTTFANNMAGGVKNDIYNEGNLSFNGGTVTLDGGITGNGTVNFADGTNLKTALLADASQNAIITAEVLNGNIGLVIDNGSTGGQVKFDATHNNLTVANSNALYNIKGDADGLYTVSKKSSSEVAAATGARSHHADTLIALTNGTGDNEHFNAISESVNTLIQSSNPADVAAGVKAAAALAPTTAPATTAQATQTVNQIFSAVSSRLSSGSVSAMRGQSSGDEILGNGAVWAKALYNKSKLSGDDGFDAYSRGLAIGAEAHVHDQVKVGVGYAYTNSDIKPTDKKNEINSNTAILYAEYKPNNWFLNGIASYTWGRNDDHKYVLGSDIGAKYDVNSLSAQVQTGYDFNIRNYTITPEIGLRYVNVDQKGFTDSIGNHTNGNKSDVFTGIVGATASAEYVINADVSLKPEIRLAAKYDFVNDDVASVMTLANGAVVSSQGKSLKKMSGEVGLGLTAYVTDKVELGIAYQGEYRKHYTDNTGMITAKYNF